MFDETKYPNVSSMHSLPRLVATRARDKPRNPRVVDCLLGSGSTLEYRVHTSTFPNLMRGIYERLFFVKVEGKFQRPPQPMENIYSTRLGLMRQQIVGNVSKANPISRREFADMYQARRRTRYHQAVDSLEIQAVSRRDALVRTFNKVERYCHTLKPDAACRIISPRDPRYNVEVGRFLKPLEHRLYDAITKLFGERTIAKGMNGVTVGRLAREKWEKYRNPVAISIDASRFDQHVSKQALIWEHWLYVQCFARKKDRKRLAEMLEMQLVNKGLAIVDGHKIKYTVEGSRMSGDMNTALGNCLIACCLMKSFCDEYSIPFSLLNNGDDCVIICEREHYPKFKRAGKFFLDFGFNMIQEDPVYAFSEISFCQGNFIWNGNEWVHIRHPKVCTAKDSISLIPFHSEAVMRGWLRAVGDGGLALNSGVPVLQEFYEMYRRESRGVSSNVLAHPAMETGLRFLAMGMDPKYRDISCYSRFTFWEASGILPDAQIELENYYRKHTIENIGSVQGDTTPLHLL